jgi:aspartyl-tRNA(Asn)/glutamyl-tRNA(Gln) amidotransferase subunit A
VVTVAVAAATAVVVPFDVAFGDAPSFYGSPLTTPAVWIEASLACVWAADAALARGEAGPLTGLPYANKDIFCTAGVKTTCASRMLANWRAPYDATVVSKLASAGMVMLGKTNMDEFAMGSSNETSWFGPVRNPWALERVPGGSSGGSAAALAAGLTALELGSDIGASIRNPAH